MAQEPTVKEKLFEFTSGKPVETDIKIGPIKTEAELSTPAPTTKPPAVSTMPSVSISAPAPVTAPKKEEDVFLTNLFEKKNEEQKSGSKLMQGLIETEAKQVEKRSILGKAPEVDTKLFIDIEYHLKKKLSLVKGVFIGICVVSALFAGWAYTTLNPSLSIFSNQNTGALFEDTNQKLKDKQTELNKLYYKNFKRRLDQLVYAGSDFRAKYNVGKDGLEEAKKTVLDKFNEIVSATTAYKNYSDLAVENQMSDIEAQIYFNQLLKDSIANDLNDPKISDDDKTEYKAILQIIEDPDANGARPLHDIFKTKKENLTDEETATLLDQIDGVYKNQLTTFNQIKNSRINWADYLGEISAITRKTDVDYITDLFASSFSTGTGIKYSAFNIDENNAIKISGTAITPDERTFTILADLLDKFTASSAFKNVDMRTFYKTNDQQNAKFTSNFSIAADLDPKWNKN